MRAFWIAVETLDLTTFRLLDRVDRLFGRQPLSERLDKTTVQTPEPTPPPKFEK